MHKQEYLQHKLMEMFGTAERIEMNAHVFFLSLEAAYAEGAASTQFAPAAPRSVMSQVYAVTDAECTVQAFTGSNNGTVDLIEVCIDKRLGQLRTFLHLPVDKAEDVEYLYELCKAQRVDVFKAIVEATQEVKRLYG